MEKIGIDFIIEDISDYYEMLSDEALDEMFRIEQAEGIEEFYTIPNPGTIN